MKSNQIIYNSNARTITVQILLDGKVTEETVFEVSPKRDLIHEMIGIIKNVEFEQSSPHGNLKRWTKEHLEIFKGGGGFCGTTRWKNY